jgi:NTP pyrophosphatase (non-canonical NTP hydrolase)
MSDQKSEKTFSGLVERIKSFRDARDWDQFHTLKDLSAALAIEAAELQEIMLWSSNEQIQQKSSEIEFRQKIQEECADILNYLILISLRSDFDLVEAANKKIDKNEIKYPVDKAKGSSKKYNQL